MSADFFEQLHDNLSMGHTISSHAINEEYHMHNIYELYILRSGSIFYSINDSRYHLKAGDILLISDRDLHRAENPSGQVYERFTIHFNQHLLAKLSTSVTHLTACFEEARMSGSHISSLPASHAEEYYHLAERCCQALDQPPDRYGSDLLPYTYLIQILIRTNECYQQTQGRPASLFPPAILRIMEYIDSHFTENLHLDELSAQINMDKYYASRLFKEATGTSIYQYILLKRISLAKDLLSKGCSVTDACLMTGFGDYANFIRTFKKLTGISPGKYKNTYL